MFYLHRFGEINLRVLNFYVGLCLRYERFRSGRSSAQSVNNGVSQQLFPQVVKRPIFASPLMFFLIVWHLGFSVRSVDLHVTIPVRLYNVLQVLLSVSYVSVIYPVYMPN